MRATPLVARPFDTDRDELAQRVGPGHETAVTGGDSRYPLGAQRTTKRIDGMGDVELLVGVPHLRVHDLRHWCATLLFTMGVQPATMQRIPHHSSITVTTGTYVEVIEAVQRDALDSMGSLFATAPDTNK